MSFKFYHSIWLRPCIFKVCYKFISLVLLRFDLSSLCAALPAQGKVPKYFLFDKIYDSKSSTTTWNAVFISRFYSATLLRLFLYSSPLIQIEKRMRLYNINYKSIIVFKKGVYYQALRLQNLFLFQLISTKQSNYAYLNQIEN